MVLNNAKNFGKNVASLTIKGKANTHIESHKKIIEIMDRLPKTKEKENTFGDSKIKIIEKLPKKTFITNLKDLGYIPWLLCGCSRTQTA